jgi:hypothetical protein
MRLNGTEAQLARIGDTVRMKSAIVAECVESRAQIGMARDRRGDFHPCSEQRHLDANSHSRGWVVVLSRTKSRLQDACANQNQDEEE